MAVVEKTQSNEEKQAMAEDLKSKSADIARDFIKQIDLPASLQDSIETSEEQKDDAERAEETDGQDSDVSEANADDSEAPQESEEEAPEQKKDNTQKRIDELTRQKKILEQRLAKVEKEQSSRPSQDPDLDKLEKMTESDLKTLKKNVRLLQIKNSADDAKVSELMELEDKIENVIKTAPQRFQANQVRRFEEAVASTELENFESKKADIFNSAKEIFLSYPELQKSEMGQATAWDMAVKLHEKLSTISAGKSKVNELERKVNTMKKRVSLDTAVQKGNSKVSDETKIFNRAKSGGESDKLRFFKSNLKTDSFIPEEYLR